MKGRALELEGSVEFGHRLEQVRTRAGLSPAELARSSRVSRRRILALEDGRTVPTDRELGALAQACRVSVFELIPPGLSLSVLGGDPETPGAALRGDAALNALLREYLVMVLELRQGNPVTAPSLRHDDLVELAAALGGTPEAIEHRLVELLGAGADEAHELRTMILPSTGAPAHPEG